MTMRMTHLLAFPGPGQGGKLQRLLSQVDLALPDQRQSGQLVFVAPEALRPSLDTQGWESNSVGGGFAWVEESSAG